MQNKENPKNADKNDLSKFSEKFIAKYFENIRNTIKTRVPNMLYMGCRFADTANSIALKQTSKFCDIISYNIYSDSLEDLTLPKGMDKPIMIGEFHFGALDRGPFHAALMLTKDQNDRANHYYNYVESA